VEHQPQDDADHAQNQIEHRRERLAVQQQPDRRQQGSEQQDHRRNSGVITQDLGRIEASAMAAAATGCYSAIPSPILPKPSPDDQVTPDPADRRRGAVHGEPRGPIKA
jgi:hypothetical protein